MAALEYQIDRARVREFRGRAEAAVLLVEETQRRFNHRVNDTGIERTARGVVQFSFGDSFFESASGVVDIGAFIAKCFGNAEENTFEAGAAHRVFGRKIGAAEERLAVGREESGEWPAALP